MRGILAILPLALLVASCSAEGNITVDVKSTSQAVVEPPTPGQPVPPAPPRLLATISRIAVHVATSGIEMSDEAFTGKEDTDGWTTIFEGDQTINLLDSASVARTLGSAPAPEGTVTQVRLYIKDDVVLFDESGEHAVTCPSCTESGLKLVTSSQVEVERNGVLRLTLNFDADKSLVENPNGLILKPTIRVEAVNEQ
jgi:hypothetical protein